MKASRILKGLGVFGAFSLAAVGLISPAYAGGGHGTPPDKCYGPDTEVTQYDVQRVEETDWLRESPGSDWTVSDQMSVEDEPAVPAEGEPTIEVDNPDYVPAWTETIDHPEVTDVVHHDAVYQTEWKYVKHGGYGEVWVDNDTFKYVDANGKGSNAKPKKGVYYNRTQDTRQTLVKEAWEETVVVTDAWTETVAHPAEGEPTIVVDNPDYVPAKDAVTHDEYRYTRTLTQTGVTDVPDGWTVTNEYTVTVPGEEVECPDDSGPGGDQGDAVDFTPPAVTCDFIAGLNPNDVTTVEQGYYYYTPAADGYPGIVTFTSGEGFEGKPGNGWGFPSPNSTQLQAEVPTDCSDTDPDPTDPTDPDPEVVTPVTPECGDDGLVLPETTEEVEYGWDGDRLVAKAIGDRVFGDVDMDLWKVLDDATLTYIGECDVDGTDPTDPVDPEPTVVPEDQLVNPLEGVPACSDFEFPDVEGVTYTGFPRQDGHILTWVIVATPDEGYAFEGEQSRMWEKEFDQRECGSVDDSDDDDSSGSEDDGSGGSTGPSTDSGNDKSDSSDDDSTSVDESSNQGSDSSESTKPVKAGDAKDNLDDLARTGFDSTPLWFGLAFVVLGVFGLVAVRRGQLGN